MPINVVKIDSNTTGLRYSEETSIGVANANAVWYPLEPNAYSDFGGEIKTVARNPINIGRQNKKGVTVDLDATAGFNNDLTLNNLSDILQGLFFASFRRKAEYGVAIGESFSSTGANTYVRPSGSFTAGTSLFAVGDLIFGEGFSLSTANGLKQITAIAATIITTSETVGVISSPVVNEGSVVKVGVQLGSGITSVAVSGAYASIVRSGGDFTTLGLIPGEWIYIGGEAGPLAFANAANNGYKRVFSVSASTIVVDKSATPMVVEAGGSLTIQIFLARVIKNESTNTLQVRRTYQLERTLGSPDTTAPSSPQTEYVVGGVFNELKINIPTADKVTADLSFIGTNNEQRSFSLGVKSALATYGRPALTESDALTTSSDVQRISLAQTSAAEETVTPLFLNVTDLSIMIKNNASPNKAVAILGAFDVSVGNFMVEASMTAYFNDIAAITAVRNNVDVTLDVIFARSNKGIVIDIPMISLANGRADVQQDQPITVPLTANAATGAKYSATMDHTALMCFFDYLPSVATV